MMMMVEGGRLLRVMGTPRSALGYWYSPACVELDGPRDRIELPPVIDSKVEANGEFEFGEDTSALWARARVGPAFEYRPLQIADGRDDILDHGFVAVRVSEGPNVRAIPFVCTADPHSLLTFTFPRSGPRSEERTAIANGFLAVLARSEPARFVAEGLEWETFDDWGDSDGATWVVVGFDGNVYYNADLECLSLGRPADPAARHQCLRPRRRVRRCV